MKTAPLEKPSSKGREAKEGECGNSPARTGAGSESPRQRRGQDRGCGQGAEQTPPWHPGMQQQGIVSLWPLEHGAVGTSQQVQAGQGVCGTSTVWWW